MPRKRKETPENFNDVFPTRMRTLLVEQNVTQEDLASYIGRTRQAVSYYCDGSSSPDWKILAKIAKYLNVTTDYLVGLSDAKKAENADIVERLGLTETAITKLEEINEKSAVLRSNEAHVTYTGIVSRILSSPIFESFLSVACFFYYETERIEKITYDDDHEVIEALRSNIPDDSHCKIIDSLDYVELLCYQASRQWQRIFEDTIGSYKHRADNTDYARRKLAHMIVQISDNIGLSADDTFKMLLAKAQATTGDNNGYN